VCPGLLDGRRVFSGVQDDTREVQHGAGVASEAHEEDTQAVLVTGLDENSSFTITTYAACHCEKSNWTKINVGALTSQTDAGHDRNKDKRGSKMKK
jgi:hypothetical protein